MYESRHLTETLGGELVTASGKSMPPVTVAALSVAGVSLQDWVFIGTLVYLVLQSAYLVWKWLRERRRHG